MKFHNKIAVLFTFLLQGYAATHCAEAPRALTFLDQATSAVEQATLLPRVLAELVVQYDGGRKIGLKKRFPAEDGDCQQAVLACGLLACITRDGKMTLKNLITGNTVKTQELLSPEEKKLACIKNPITALPDDHLVIPLTLIDEERGELVVLHTKTGKFIHPEVDEDDAESLKEFQYVLLPNNELVAYHPGDMFQKVFDITTGEHKRTMDYGYNGCRDMILLPDNTVAAIGSNDKIILSDLQSPLKQKTIFFGLEGLIHSSTRTVESYAFDKSRLAPLSDNKLAVAACCQSEDPMLAIIDLNKSFDGLLPMHLRFNGAQGIDLVGLSDDFVATKMHQSGEVIVVDFSNDFVQLYSGMLDGASPAKNIQGVANGDLFVQYANDESALFGQSDDMSFYEQKVTPNKKKAWVLV